MSKQSSCSRLNTSVHGRGPKLLARVLLRRQVRQERRLEMDRAGECRTSELLQLLERWLRREE
jgi:hypothetical protein